MKIKIINFSGNLISTKVFKVIKETPKQIKFRDESDISRRRFITAEANSQNLKIQLEESKTNVHVVRYVHFPNSKKIPRNTKTFFQLIRTLENYLDVNYLQIQSLKATLYSNFIEFIVHRS